MRTFATEIEKRFDSVAQLVEQMTLNHWVESSSLSGVTKQSLKSGCFFYFCRPQAVAYLQHASARTGLWKSAVALRRESANRGMTFIQPLFGGSWECIDVTW